MRVHISGVNSCKIGAFYETFLGSLTYYSRMTERLVDCVTILAVETGYEASACTMRDMNVEVSGDMVIRMLLREDQAQSRIPYGSHVGVDDFAFKKRYIYGTIIIDEGFHMSGAVLEWSEESALKE